jgi:hypothetical protein
LLIKVYKLALVHTLVASTASPFILVRSLVWTLDQMIRYSVTLVFPFPLCNLEEQMVCSSSEVSINKNQQDALFTFNVFQ